jgi:hypothetical protein
MVRERVGDWRSAWRFALAGLLAGFLVVATSQTAVVAPLFYALQDQLFPAPAPASQVTAVVLAAYAVDEMPGLQLKGKSAETFRLFNVTAIRQDKTSPWVQFPTAAAMTSYADYRRQKTQSPVAATTQDGP